MSRITQVELNWALQPGEGSLSRQLSDHIRAAVRSGTLKPGDRIPATRQLAKDLGVARGTVATAMELLIAEGFLETRPGSGTFISDAAALDTRAIAEIKPDIAFAYVPPDPDVDLPASVPVDFRPCRPSLEIFPMNVWRRCMAAAASAVPDSDYGDPHGAPRLRDAIASYLRRARGLSVSPDQIIVTNGSVQAMHILASLFLGPKTAVAFEDPGFPLARQVFAATGAALHFCPVDEDGLVTETLLSAPDQTRLIYVTPSHQFPTGARLSLKRRHELVEWATQNGALILEDDYDGEYRYDVPPLAPLAAFAPEAVVYCGTFSKTMFPGLRIGFAVAPRSIIKAMARYRTVTEYAPNALTQSALTKFIDDGEFERHVLRMRRLYSQKRKHVASLLLSIRREARLTGIESGLSGLIELGDTYRAEIISAKLSEKGVLIPPLSKYAMSPTKIANALVCGYAEPSLEKIRTGFDRLKRLLDLDVSL